MSFQFTDFSQVNIANSPSSSKSPNESNDRGRPEKQRGLWSFLTWSFFLANFLTATEGFGGGAQAAALDDNSRDATHPDDNGNQGSHSLPGFEKAVLESVPASHESVAPEQKVAMNLVAPATMPAFGLQPVQTSFSPESTSHPAMGSHGSSVSPGILFGGDGGNTVNNYYYSQDSHDINNSTTNNTYNIDNHDTTGITIVQPVVEIVPVHAVPSLLSDPGDIAANLPAAVETIADAAVSAVSNVVADVGVTVGDLVSGVGSTLESVAQGASSVVADVGDVVSAVPSAIGSVVDALTPAVENVASDLGDAVGHGASGLGDILGSLLHTATTAVADVVDTVSTVPAAIEEVADSIAPAVTTVVADVSETVGHLASGAGDIVDTALHTVTSAVPDVVDTVSTVLPSVTNIVADVGSLLHPDSGSAPASGGGGPLDVVHNVMSDLGVSSSGSLNFAAGTTDPTTDHASSATGYSQYNLAVEDAATPEAPATPTDTGGIGSIITSALGLGQHTTSDSNSSHSNDQQQSHIPLVDDLTSHLHHGLFG